MKVAVDLDDKTKLENMNNVLNSLGIKVDEIKLEESDYFDKYDIRLTPGTRVNKVERSLPDIGLSMRAQSTPRGYSIMKEGVFRIEIQKQELPVSYFKYSKPKTAYAPILLGMNAEGKRFYRDLHKMPNLLIGGIPGSGKSVLLHSIILSLIHARARLFLIDPKLVEFNLYEGNRQVEAMGSTVEETLEIIKSVHDIMESRFSRLTDNKCRNIHEYNKKVKPHKRMRPVVVIVDEWADIVLQNKSVQKPLCVVAQKGRAAGISIILATQRPSSDVISGLIKANFSGRISMRVATKLESRIILDQSGGETINDVGVGLYIDHRVSEPVLFRAPWIEDPDHELREFKAEEYKKKTFWQRLWG